MTETHIPYNKDGHAQFYVITLKIAYAADIHETPCKVGLKTGSSHLLTAGAHLKTFAFMCARVCAGASKEPEIVLNVNS